MKVWIIEVIEQPTNLDALPYGGFKVDALNKIISLNPKVVVPGHFGNKANLTIASVKYTKTYLQTYEQLLKTNKNSKSLIATLKVRYPKAVFQTGLEMEAKVNTGEMEWK